MDENWFKAYFAALQGFAMARAMGTADLDDEKACELAGAQADKSQLYIESRIAAQQVARNEARKTREEEARAAVLKQRFYRRDGDPRLEVAAIDADNQVTFKGSGLRVNLFDLLDGDGGLEPTK